MESARIASARVNGETMATMKGRYVSIIGRVISQSERNFQMHTTDLKTVTVRMVHPLSEPLGGWIEVEGVVQGPAEIDCQQYVPFEDSTQVETNPLNFNADAYNRAVQLATKRPDYYVVSA